MEAFVEAFVEACVFFFRGSFHNFHESGSFHELPRKKQLVQETDLFKTAWTFGLLLCVKMSKIRYFLQITWF